MDYVPLSPLEPAAHSPQELAVGEPPRLSTHQAGMIAFLITEAAFFSTLLMTYVYFLRQVVESKPGPTEVFDELWLTIAATICLLSSSFTIYLAEKALHRADQNSFLAWLGLTVALGVIFLAGTGLEWQSLIGKFGLSLSRNMFGSAYFTLVGFHALHVTMGVLAMTIVLGLGLRGQVTHKNSGGVQLISWYWHFVDGVWVVVFTLVYFVGR